MLTKGMYPMSHIMRKSVFALCEQQRRRSACASTQSDQRLYYSLPRHYNTSSFYVRNSKPLLSFCSWAGRFVSYLVENSEDRFSHDGAHIQPYIFFLWLKSRKSLCFNILSDKQTVEIDSANCHLVLWLYLVRYGNVTFVKIGHSLPTANSSRAVVSYWWKNVH